METGGSRYDDFSYAETFSTDIPDLEGFIRELDMFKENVNKALRLALHHCGERIAGAQRRFIRYKSKRLSDAIGVGNVYTTQSGVLGIRVGYLEKAFELDNSLDPPARIGVVGLVYEFGRPGQSNGSRSSPETYRHVNGNSYKVKKGAIQPIPHIRRGFDEIKEYCVRDLIRYYEEELDKL